MLISYPQVVMTEYFSKLAGSESLSARKFLNALLTLQYVPRLVRVYLSAKEVGSGLDSLARRVSVRGAFFFIHYIIFGHVSHKYKTDSQLKVLSLIFFKLKLIRKI